MSIKSGSTLNIKSAGTFTYATESNLVGTTATTWEHTSAGNIEAESSTLSGDGKYVTYVKTYKDRAAFTQYTSETSSGLNAEAVVLNFQRINEEE